MLFVAAAGGMAYGSCGKEFRDAFSCFHYSTEDLKGSDCVDSFMKMHNCFQEYPEEYGKFADDEEEEGVEESRQDDKSNRDEEIDHTEGKMESSNASIKERSEATSVLPSLTQPINSGVAS